MDDELRADAEQSLLFLGFTGTHHHSLDAKNRLIVPVPFREGLGAHFVICPTPDFQYIALYPLKDWLERRDALKELVRKNPRAQKILDMFSKYSYTNNDLDNQGRIVLPPQIRAWRLRDAKELDICGDTNHIRLVPAESSQKEDAEFDVQIPDPLGYLSSLMNES